MVASNSGLRPVGRSGSRIGTQNVGRPLQRGRSLLTQIVTVLAVGSLWTVLGARPGSKSLCGDIPCVSGSSGRRCHPGSAAGGGEGSFALIPRLPCALAEEIYDWAPRPGEQEPAAAASVSKLGSTKLGSTKSALPAAAARKVDGGGGALLGYDFAPTSSLLQARDGEQPHHAASSASSVAQRSEQVNTTTTASRDVMAAAGNKTAHHEFFYACMIGAAFCGFGSLLWYLSEQPDTIQLAAAENYPADDTLPQAAAAAAAAVQQSAEVLELQTKLSKLREDRTQLLMEAAIRKRKLDTIYESMLEAEAQISTANSPTEDEIKKRSEEAWHATEMMTQKGIISAIAFAVPLMTQTEKIYQAVEKRMLLAQERARDLALAETKSFLCDLQEVFGAEDVSDINFNIFHNLHFASLSALIASAFAPAQLRLLWGFNTVSASMSGIYEVVNIIVLLVDWRTQCMNHLAHINPGLGESTLEGRISEWWEDAMSSRIYIWFMIDFCVHAMCLVVRLRVTSAVGALIAEIERPPEIKVVDAPVEAVRLLLDYYLTTGGRALVLLDRVLSSSLFLLAHWSVIFDVIWLTYCTHLVFNTPWSECQSIGLIVLRIRSTIFLVFFLIYVMNIAFFLVDMIMHSTKFTVTVLSGADKLDRFLALGFPVAKIIAHALVVRNSADMIQIQLHMHKMTKESLDKAQQKHENDLIECIREQQELAVSINRLNQEIGSFPRTSSDQEFKAEYEEMKQKIIDNSAEVYLKLNKRASGAMKRAATQLDEWEQGEGLLQTLQHQEWVQNAMSTGQDLMTEEGQRNAMEQGRAMAAKVTETASQAQALAKDSETAKQMMRQGMEMGTAASSAAQEVVMTKPSFQQAYAQGMEAASGTVPLVMGRVMTDDPRLQQSLTEVGTPQQYGPSHGSGAAWQGGEQGFHGGSEGSHGSAVDWHGVDEQTWQGHEGEPHDDDLYVPAGRRLCSMQVELGNDVEGALSSFATVGEAGLANEFEAEIGESAEKSVGSPLPGVAPLGGAGSVGSSDHPGGEGTRDEGPQDERKKKR